MSQDSPLSDGRPPFQFVADTLRTEIEDGQLDVGHRIPTQHELTARFDVSRATIQRALNELKATGYIESHQGLGTFVADWQERGRSPAPSQADAVHAAVASLPKALEAAFRADRVTMDVFSFSAETLSQALSDPLAKVRTQKLQPQQIDLRLLVPDERSLHGLPRSVEDPSDPRPALRLREIIKSSTFSVLNTLRSLQFEGLVPAVSVEIREAPVTPMEKVYLLNGHVVLRGYYKVVERVIPFRGEDGSLDKVPIFDVLGLRSPLTYHAVGDSTGQGEMIVKQSQVWFDSLWSTVAARSRLSL